MIGGIYFSEHSEKIRLRNNFLEFNYDPKNNPHLIILKAQEKLLSENNLSKDYKKVINGKFYNVFEKIN